MKQFLIAIVLISTLISCKNSGENKRDTADSETMENNTADEVETNYVPIDSDEALIAASLMAAPAESRDGCKVIGYNMAGEFVTLREGDNEFIVLADNPQQSGFNAACYHKSLEPFMARGRELRAEGKTGPEIFDIREEEAKSGKLDMGMQGATLHIYYGESDQYNPETHEVEGAHYRYVVYLPFATAESTGLPEKPKGSNHPWIMDPGTHKAHIMISPLPKE
ncbi:hypothetical protein K1F50_17250 [Muricauda oceani]|uniref:Uncharacterized protein n=1 Tax=Flagellimonas oceani TaxID=2698672 RepID=A0A6G7J4J2_9FLAO|nr:hypothetical protein [Allomuricauda oceani]MBW8244558.1 hypothetical protein [Allomuricauda oceani]QII45793.1 hypothetical protein GVT53_14290 [Allomuricauda oceani]